LTGSGYCAVEQERVAAVASGAGELDQGGRPVRRRDQSHGPAQSGDRGGGAVNLPEFIAVYPERVGQQVPITNLFGQPERTPGAWARPRWLVPVAAR
jgi:hypothetical protein